MLELQYFDGRCVDVTRATLNVDAHASEGAGFKAAQGAASDAAPNTPTVCLYLHVHQPVRLAKHSLFHTPAGEVSDLKSLYFDGAMNREVLERAARKSYLPTNELLLKLVEENRPDFRFSLSITGVFIEQCLKNHVGEEVLEGFKALVSTGCVDILDETHYHSLASLFKERSEFLEQVKLHNELVKSIFGTEPKVFRNTEALYSNEIAAEVEAMGYDGIVAEGWHSMLGWRSPNYLYNPVGCKSLKVLLRNYKLSDDIGYRFSARWWSEWPLTAGKYASWLAACEGQTINIFMDYETFGEHHWQETGILEFLRHLPREVLARGLRFLTARETVRRYPVVGKVDCPYALSWADMERDVSAWLGNRIQRACFERVERLGKSLKEAKARLNGEGRGGRGAELAQLEQLEQLESIWRLFTTSDHYYYMCTKSWADGDVHKHFSPHKDFGPYDNYANFTLILEDFRREFEKRVSSDQQMDSQVDPQIREARADGLQRIDRRAEVNSQAVVS